LPDFFATFLPVHCGASNLFEIQLISGKLSDRPTLLWASRSLLVTRIYYNQRQGSEEAKRFSGFLTNKSLLNHKRIRRFSSARSTWPGQIWNQLYWMVMGPTETKWKPLKLQAIRSLARNAWIATHILAFEGESTVVRFEGSYSENGADYESRLWSAADQPLWIKYRPPTRSWKNKEVEDQKRLTLYLFVFDCLIVALIYSSYNLFQRRVLLQTLR